MVRRRRGRKRALGMRAPMTLPLRINQRWSLDFVSDTLSDGRRFRILCIVDDYSRECLAAVVDTSLGGVRVVRELERLVDERALPERLVSDKGTELTSGAVLRWATRRVAWALHRTGQAGAERLHRIIQQQAPRRVPERIRILDPGGSTDDHRGLASGLQPSTTTLESRCDDAERVRSDQTGANDTAPRDRNNWRTLLIDGRKMGSGHDLLRLPSSR